MHAQGHTFGRTLERKGLGTRASQVIRHLTIAALVFQFVHFVEHIAQLSYWFLRPAAPPWLTPWAETGAGAELLWAGPRGAAIDGRRTAQP